RLPLDAHLQLQFLKIEIERVLIRRGRERLDEERADVVARAGHQWLELHMPRHEERLARGTFELCGTVERLAFLIVGSVRTAGVHERQPLELVDEIVRRTNEYLERNPPERVRIGHFLKVLAELDDANQAALIARRPHHGHSPT